jgi:hypothetical protein
MTDVKRERLSILFSDASVFEIPDRQEQSQYLKNKSGKFSFECFPLHNLVNRSLPNYVKLQLL